MATATMSRRSVVVKKPHPLETARSPVNIVIYENLDRKSWTPQSDLVEAVKEAGVVTQKEAIEVFEFRIGRGRPISFSRQHKIGVGMRYKVLLDCITLVRLGKIEQRGRGQTKEYRLA